jgi:hypothetical protein
LAAGRKAGRSGLEGVRALGYSGMRRG